MKKILAIDDQRDNLTTIEAVIKNHFQNCKVLTALSGKEGIKIAKEELPDTILLDIIMPQMDGYEVCKRLKEDELTKHIPVVMITAIKTDAESRIKGLNLGADAFSSKPIDPFELSAQVNVMLRIKEAEDKLRSDKDLLDQKVKERTKELLESEEKFKRITEHIYDIIFAADLKGNISYVSPSVIRVFGYQPEELIGRNIMEFVPKAEIPHVIETFTISGTGKNIDEHYSEFLKKDGSVANITISAVPIIENDKIVGAQAIIHDITERKQNEKALKSSTERLRILFESAPDAYYMSDLKGNFLDGNKAAEDMLGYKKVELIGKSFVKLKLLSAKELLKASKILLKNVQGKGTGPDEFILNCKDGRQIPVEIRTYPVKINDKTVVLGIARDITARMKMDEVIKESEERWRGLSEAAFEAIFISEKGICLEQNSVAEKMFGYTLSDSIGMKGTDWIVPEDREMVMNNMLSGYEEPYEATALRKDGSTFPVEIQGRMMHYKGRTVRVTALSNITKRKHVEEDLIKSEERFRQITENLQEWIWEVDINGLYIYASPVMENLLGYTPEEIVGKKHFYDLFHPEDREALKIAALDAFNQKLSFNEFINRNLNKKGEIVWLSTSGVPILDNNGNLLGYRGADVNITERKQAEERLKESEEKYSSVVENSVDGIMVFQKGIIKFLNQALFDITGYNFEELMDKEFEPFISPECRKFVMNRYQARLAGKDVPSIYEMEIIGKDGILVPIEVNSTIITYGGEVSILAFIRDITERKRTERIQKVLYNISNAVITTDNLNKLISLVQKELGTIIDTTNFYIALFDHKTDKFSLPFFVDEKDELISFPAGKTLTNYVVKTQKSLLATKEVLEVLEQRGEVESFGTNSEIWLGVPLKIEGKVTGVLAVQSYTDEFAYDESDMEILEFIADQISISIDRKKAEEDLISALSKAKESDRLKSAFLANMSHEIRTPMNGIMGFADLLKEPGLSSDEQQKYIRIIENSGKRMLNTINDLIDISMVESGQMKVSISDMNINEQTENLYSFFKPEAERKGIELSLNNSLQAKESIVKTDSEKVYAILTNLIKNAIKYSHEGSIEFGYVLTGSATKTVTEPAEQTDTEPVKPATTEPVEVEFFVKDTGIGIPDDRKQAIFDRFVQADIEDKAAYEGSGLGLSISKAYVEMLGGKIWVESEEDVGSQFYFTIPCDTGKKEIAKSKLAKSGGILEQQLKKLKILIAEDDKLADIHLSILTKKISKEILHAKTGNETVEICRDNPDIDLVLMDIRMPEMDGYEATRKIREFNKDIVIIAQTAYALAGDREKALEAGCNDYTSKPIKKEALMAKIVKCLSG